MPAPSFSSQSLNNYSITTEGTTTATAVILNTPTDIVMYVDGQAFILSLVSTNTYSKEIYGFEIGTCSSASVVFMATNASGGARAVAASGLTVAAPSHPVPAEIRLVNRIMYLIANEKSWGGNGVLSQSMPMRDIRWQSLQPDLVKQMLFIHALSSVPKYSELGGTDWLLDPNTIRFEYNADLSVDTNTDAFYQVADEVRWFVQYNNAITLSPNVNETYYGTISNIRYPSYNPTTIDGGQMIVDVNYSLRTGG